ncbi:hypothetical protein QC764_200730 [Podospora pseudoanserina]|uniref:Ribosomal RNA-processing protein 7 n=1 Tax=Podospora pseudoanserina TaxID=2609844 RepID=A0ABR0IG23_9PEZI|nr:hypothetical protein QC764_200730 [Podospora pseudoanserina]
MPSTPPTLGDFTVLPISFPPLPSFPEPTTHYLYLRRNTPKIPTPTDSRSLFLTNCPVDSTDIHLRSLFVSLVGPGRFESATFEDERKDTAHKLSPLDAAVPVNAVHLLRAHGSTKKRKREEEEDAERSKEDEAARLPSTWTRPLRRSGSTAVVLLADEKSVEQALKACAKASKTKKYPEWGAGVADKVPALGSVWVKQHNRLCYPDPATLQQAVDAFSAVFARREKEAAEISKRLRNEPDEDGFVTVTRGGRNAPASRSEAEEARKKMIERAEKKRQEMEGLYRFQLREKQKEEQEELLMRFEDDRKKLEAMRMKRGKFVPEA